METGTWNYADESRWSDARIIERFHELRLHLETQVLSEDRKRQIAHELSCVAFEGLQREQVKKRREEEVAWMEHAYELPDSTMQGNWVLDE